MMDENQALEKLKKIPKWMKENEDGTFDVEIYGKIYKMKEQDGLTMEKCERMAKRTNTSMEVLLTPRSIVDPKMSDAEFGALGGKTYMKLKMATIYLYGMNDFL